MTIDEAVSQLIKAEESKQPIEPLTTTYPDITPDEAYQIQLKVIDDKLNKGAKIVGKKIGLTSKAMQRMVNVDEPDYGHLLDNMLFIDGAEVSVSQYLQPRVEFEIGFVLKDDLVGPEVRITDVINAIDYAVPAFEIIDSRIKDWKIGFCDTVADNGSSAGAVLGAVPTKIDNLDLKHIGMVVYRNGELLDTGASGAVMGNPLKAIVWLANSLNKYGVQLKAGEIVLAGALTKAIDVDAGDHFTMTFDHLGSADVHFTA